MTVVSNPTRVSGFAEERRATAVRKPRTRETETEAREDVGLRRVGLAGVLVDLRQDLRELMLSTGTQVLAALLEADRVKLCGPRSQPQEGRTAARYGFDEGTLVLGGRKVRVQKPRVRGPEGEVELPSWRRFSEEDPLSERVLEQMMVGVSTRKYGRSLEAPPVGVASVATSRSSVSRRFVARTAAQVQSFLGASLAERDIVVVMIDGTYVGDHVLVVALGIDAEGGKHVLGVREGSTENATVCGSLLSDLIDRGLTADRNRLFVIDGGKGLRKAIRSVFGAAALIQRCQVHKLRNVLEHLPEREKDRVRRELVRAWGSESKETAVRRLHALARQMEVRHPSAAESLREGLEETTTVLDLGVSGALLRTLRSTNPIENLQGAFKRIARNVKRWRGGQMAERWSVTALIEAQGKFRRIRGHREMPQLIHALRPPRVTDAVLVENVA